jgi:hypothetical protein
MQGDDRQAGDEAVAKESSLDQSGGRHGGTGGSYISSSDLHEDIIAMYERRVEALVRTPHCHCVHTISRGEGRE